MFHMGLPRDCISSTEQNQIRIRIEGVQHNTAEFISVQLKVRIVPVQRPVGKYDSVSDSDL
jgi:hypothetical protein